MTFARMTAGFGRRSAAQDRLGDLAPSTEGRATGRVASGGYDRAAAALAPGNQRGYRAERSAAARRVPGRQPLTTSAHRAQTDPEVYELGVRAITVLEQMGGRGQDWEAQWGKQGHDAAQKKAMNTMTGKKGPSTTWTVGKKAWDELLTIEEKIEVAKEAAKLGSRAFLTVAQELMGHSGSSSAAKRPKPKKKGRSAGRQVASAAVDALSEMTAEDYEMVYRMLQRRRKFNRKLREVQEQIAGMAGDVGQAVGGFAGGLRDEYDFSQTVSASRQPFFAVVDQFERCSQRITAHGDRERYNALMAELQQAFMRMDILRPAFLSPNEEYRRAFPARCAEQAQAIKDELSRFKGAHTQSGLIGGVSAWLGLRSPADRLSGDPGLIEAQVKAATALERALKANWSPVTKWGSVPSGVKRLRALTWGHRTRAYLQEAQRMAAASFASRGGRRHAVTHEFYRTLSQLDPDQAGSLRQLMRSLGQTQRDLAR